MLQNIFIINFRDFSNLESKIKDEDFSDLKIYSYPEDLFSILNKKLVRDLILGFKITELNHEQLNSKSPLIFYPLITEGENIFSCMVFPDTIIGLILDKDDNPYDLKEIFTELVEKEFVPIKQQLINNDFELENYIISGFIDVRRYYDEILGYSPFLAFKDHGSILKVFIFGIDEAGKTSYVRRVTTGEYDENYFEPTRQFNIEHFTYKDVNFILWDMPGQASLRPKWLLGMQDSNMLIYMIDAADEVRFEESKKELWKILDRYELEGVPLLILVNKIDLPFSQTTEKELIEIFGLNEVTNRTLDVMYISVADNININKSMDWLKDKASAILPNV